MKETHRRKRMSLAMKESWKRRRNGTQPNPPNKDQLQQDEIIRLIGLLQKLMPHNELVDKLTDLAHKQVDTFKGW